VFKKILIANRGEIACRVMRTCKKMGIATVGVYSDADRTAWHTTIADETVRIGEPPPRSSYLSIGRIVEAAREIGADAVHPGYGFLSENADFAEACELAGLAFIGPRPATIRTMALKDGGKQIAREVGVPVLSGDWVGGDDAALLEQAEKIGFPVLIKAVAGGGGRGMRRVDDVERFQASLDGARREALTSFGDDRVLVEKYLSEARHIEVQVFGDTFGNVVHLFERDCSIQRRHQKIIEESPAPGLPAETREALTSAAVAIARRVGYCGAGTVEFIADVSDSLRPDRFWFMEMNTRLQVEHPITEMVTGIDLVEWQIRVAAGEPLLRLQNDIRAVGYAIEARICAEDPRKKYLPSPGLLSLVDLPSSDARIDAGVRTGDAVTPFYDSLLAKIVVHAPTRERAIDRMRNALENSRIEGVATNLNLLHAICEHPAYRDAAITTEFLGLHGEALIHRTRPLIERDRPEHSAMRHRV
jgi:3-methylcrotonyl-CoA carboxylase alpha subunit